MSRPGFLILGRVTNASGIRGELAVAWLADSWEPFGSVHRLWLGRPGGVAEPFEVEQGKLRGRAVLLKLAGVESPEAARRLIGCEVSLPRSEAPSPPDGVFYQYDILGLEVFEGGESLGVVHEILETPAHDVYIVRSPGREWMLPATRTHVRRIDLGSGRIEIEPGSDLATVTAEGEDGSDSL